VQDQKAWHLVIPTFTGQLEHLVIVVREPFCVVNQVFTTPVEMDSAIAKDFPIKPLPVSGVLLKKDISAATVSHSETKANRPAGGKGKIGFFTN
jgi:hypothetical protein